LQYSFFEPAYFSEVVILIYNQFSDIIMSIGQRIKQLRVFKGWKQKDLADKLGIKVPTLSSWENDVHIPPHKRMKDLADCFGLTLFDLLEEEGAITETDVNGDLDEIIYIPEYQIKISAGGGAVVEERPNSKKWPLPRTFFERFFNTLPENIGVFEVTGDSMEPTLSWGDKIFINLSKTNPAMEGIFVIEQYGEHVVKRIEVIQGSDPLKLRIMSDNKLHNAYDVLADEVKIIGFLEIQMGRPRSRN